MTELTRVLCVDDEENILKAIQRSLRKSYDVRTAPGGREGLEILRKEGPFQVVVSDMRMPEMNGATFLKHVRQEWPATVRLLLTGYADLDTVVAAVNEGYIYRFLAKPCSTGILTAAIQDAVNQHNLLIAEKVLLEQTLKGSIQALTDILALASPAAFGRGTRIRKLAVAMAEDLALEDLWQLEVAAMFCQVGTITLPHETALKLYQNEILTLQEQAMVARLPLMSLSILGNIPRLEPVLNILNYMQKNFDGTGDPVDRIAGEDIPLGARILKVAAACEKLQSAGASLGRTMDCLRITEGIYDPTIMKSLLRVGGESCTQEAARGVTAHELRTGMVLTEDVRSRTGVLLVAAGQEVTVSLLERIHNYDDTTGLHLPLWIRNPAFRLDGASMDRQQADGDQADERHPAVFSLED